MRRIISIVALVIFLLTSCSPAQPSPTPTDVPTRTATATPTSLPTATPNAPIIPTATATETPVGPSVEVVNKILQEAGVEFTPETTNAYVDEKGIERCSFKYSKGILKGSQANYIQYPKPVLDYMCYNLWGRMLSLQSENADYIKDAYASIPKDLDKHVTVAQSNEVSQKAEDILAVHDNVPLKFLDTKHNTHNAEISGIEINYLSKTEFEALKASFVDPAKSIDHASIPEWANTGFNPDPNKPAPFDRNTVVAFQGNKMVVYMYDWGGVEDRFPGPDTKNGDHLAILELIPKRQTPDNTFNALIRLYWDSVDVVRMAIVGEESIHSRNSELNGERRDYNLLKGENNDYSDEAKETLTPPTP